MRREAILTFRQHGDRSTVELATQATGEVIWRGELRADLLAPGMLGVRVVVFAERGPQDGPPEPL